MRQNTVPVLLAMAVFALVATQAWGSPYASSEFLPAYCNHTKDGEIKDPATMAQYRQIYGDGFNHMHHYCRGLYALHEAANATDRTSRAGSYRRATGEFNYVLERSDATFVLRPEILVKKGMALLAIDQDIEAIRCFREAVALRPDYIPAYVAISNYLRRLGEKDEARRVLEAGLTFAPDNAYLLRKLAELDSGSAIGGGNVEPPPS